MPIRDVDSLPLAISPAQLRELIPALGKSASYVIAHALGVRVQRKIVIPRDKFLAWLRGEVKIAPTKATVVKSI